MIQKKPQNTPAVNGQYLDENRYFVLVFTALYIFDISVILFKNNALQSLFYKAV